MRAQATSCLARRLRPRRRTSFSLASSDWVHTGNVRLNSVNPTAGEFVGNFSNSNVAGNCKIYYTHPFHQYLPDESVGANNIDSGNAVAGEVLRADGSGGANFYDLQLGTAAKRHRHGQRDVATLGTGGRFELDRVAGPQPDGLRRPDARLEHGLLHNLLTVGRSCAIKWVMEKIEPVALTDLGQWMIDTFQDAVSFS